MHFQLKMRERKINLRALDGKNLIIVDSSLSNGKTEGKGKNLGFQAVNEKWPKKYFWACKVQLVDKTFKFLLTHRCERLETWVCETCHETVFVIFCVISQLLLKTWRLHNSRIQYKKTIRYHLKARSQKGSGGLIGCFSLTARFKRKPVKNPS